MVAQRSQAPRTRGAPLSHIRRPTPRHWAPPLRRPIQPRSPQFQTFPAGFVEAYAQMTGATDARPPAPPLFLLTARKPTETKRHPMSEPVHRLPRPRRSTGQSAPWHRPRARPCAQLLSQSAQHSQKPTEPPPPESIVALLKTVKAHLHTKALDGEHVEHPVSTIRVHGTRGGDLYLHSAMAKTAPESG